MCPAACFRVDTACSISARGIHYLVSISKVYIVHTCTYIYRYINTLLFWENYTNTR